jgi:hypothetical protein
VRINVYSQEMITDDDDRPLSYEQDQRNSESLPVTSLLTQTADTGIVYSAVRLFLHSTRRLHSGLEDDDRSAMTFWLPKSPERREYLARCFEDMAQWIRKAPSETGLD